MLGIDAGVLAAAVRARTTPAIGAGDGGGDRRAPGVPPRAHPIVAGAPPAAPRATGRTPDARTATWSRGTACRRRHADTAVDDDAVEAGQRTYSAGEVVDPRGRMAAGSDGSILMAGAIQAAKAGLVDLAGLIVKLTSDGALVFDKQFAGKATETGEGVVVAPDDGTIYVVGTTTTFGAGSQDAFVLHLQPTGKRLLQAFTWGGTRFETGAGVGVSGGTLMLAATTTTSPPYSLLVASARLSAPRGTLAVVNGVLPDVAGVVTVLNAGAATPAGSTIFSGNFEAALVRIAR